MLRFPADHAGMALLRNRSFALLFTGQGVSRLGDGLYVAAVAWLAWSLTHAVSAVALVTIAANAPNVEGALKFIDFMVSPEFYVKWDTDVGAPASANAKANASHNADERGRG